MISRTNITVEREPDVLIPDELRSSTRRPWMKRPVAFLATTKNIGGLERLAVRLATELTKQGADVRFICRPNSQLANLCGDSFLPRHFITVRNSGDYIAAKELARYLVEEKIGILHVHSRRDFVPAVIAVRLAGRRMHRRPRVVLHVHQVRRLGTGGRLSDAFFNWGADKVLAVSSAVKSEICTGSTLRKSLVDVLLNGVDDAEFLTPESCQAHQLRRSIRQQWSVEMSHPVIGMVGRLDQKGQRFLISNISAILDHVPAARFAFIGPDGDQSVMRDLLALAAAEGVSERIIFPGVMKDMPAAYAAMDLLVHLPLDEAFGLALAEAMASSLPVIASNIGGCSELIRNRETGLLIEPRDSWALVENIRALFGESSSRQLRSMIGSNARQSIIRNFSLARQVNDLIGVYDDIMYSRPANN